MDVIIISVIVGFGVLLSAAVVLVVVLHIRYKRMVEEKNRDIVRQIRERDRLERELEHASIELETIEKCRNGTKL